MEGWLSANTAGVVGHFFGVGNTGKEEELLGLRLYLLVIGPFGRVRLQIVRLV